MIFKSGGEAARLAPWPQTGLGAAPLRGSIIGRHLRRMAGASLMKLPLPQSNDAVSREASSDATAAAVSAGSRW